jgi:hypothetical protein
MQTQSLLLAIDKAERQLGRPGISAYAADVPTVAELLMKLGSRLPQPQICVAQVSGLRCAGFEIEQTAEPPHHTLWLPTDRTRAQAIRLLRDAFGIPRHRSKFSSR